jgi:phospholipase C
MICDPNPLYDKCFNPATKMFPLAEMNGKNVGDLLNNNNVTWGWFQGGFKPTNSTSEGGPFCGSSQVNDKGQSIVDYLPHHEPFQFYKSTANPNHLRPTSVEMIGHFDQANHQYDISDFGLLLNLRIYLLSASSKPQPYRIGMLVIQIHWKNRHLS